MMTTFNFITAKLQPNCPKPERPMREGVRRESVESGLAAAAARLANQPVSATFRRVILEHERKQFSTSFAGV